MKNKLIKLIKYIFPKNINQSVFDGAPSHVCAAYITHEGTVFWISGKIERMDNGNWHFDEMTNVGTPRGYKRKRKPIPLLHGIILRGNKGDDSIAFY